VKHKTLTKSLHITHMSCELFRRPNDLDVPLHSPQKVSRKGNAKSHTVIHRKGRTDGGSGTPLTREMAAEHLVSFGALDVWVSSSEGIPRVTAREWVSNETHLDGRRSSAI
jgi:hypothetical protein